MLSQSLMGLFALGILWVNTLLVVGAAYGVLRGLLRRLSRATAHLTTGEVIDDGPVASHTVEQVGRRASDDRARKAILFHDRAYLSRIHGGSIRTDDGTPLTLAEAEGNRVEVWLEHAELEELASCRDHDVFDEAYASASKARGYCREVTAHIAFGDQVWIVGRERDGIIEPLADGSLLIATFDPRELCRRKAFMLLAFIFAVIGAAALCSYLALYPPIFGTVSIIGGVLGLVFFLLVQPAGVLARDAALTPNRAHLRGEWIRSGSDGRGAVKPGEELYAE